ncbi:MAG: KpsF/GutQ family sugar-phosphate isomerase [Desulfobacula sp.]|jgi:arabinose-5-phosphate isomerase|uniref:KpsF/GutQ family sugar-phosphate isomerase n=1 Tax=Desulfobacula sp. TaxID=2593537 RepID=UPI001D77288F|nr:KpsF/GutQ family sugar-phosphate isomerase [Desulfobacula sp.]MBT3484421.1 KpsF/GutQ family sugar-phosphate isomerase [Desulfobacula sp.]MBT3803336.1 KpsF/GutQ family sugar-phosphate isomerase [Desulfobacula sp.]MBT4023697.1 KpsF/GutQ family sugar-phosphate isomerase [Desulfobacula sp.]MBT4197939.1 KpsF/GutQ family sugar-phosphate isomerase [Desulfobacula sp.]
MIIEKAKEALKIEADSILQLTKKISGSFERLVNAICNSRGRVIISGIGKSGLIGKKIVATLVSTGTNSIFLHPVEALHGDLGMVSGEDIFIAISNSGETNEINQLLPVIKNIGCLVAGFTGNFDSTMAKSCEILIDTGVKKEACPFNMAPTSSTTAQLAMGDALAVVLITMKKFKKSDFMKSHPGGVLGQRLSCRVGEIMFEASTAPWVLTGSLMGLALEQMDRFKLGAVIVLDFEKKLKGIITDGDIRHCMANKETDLRTQTVDKVMSSNPHSLNAKSFLYEALNIMEKYQITVLPIVEEDNRLDGILHLHDILGKGSFQFNGAGNEKL